MQPASLRYIAETATVRFLVCSEDPSQQRDVVYRQLQSNVAGLFCKSILLRILEAFPQELTDDLLFLLAPKHLRHVKLTGCDKLTVAGLNKTIEKCSQLQFLDFTKCIHLLHPSMFCCLKDKAFKLTGVSMEESELVTDDIVQVLLLCCPSLQHLNLSSCVNITDHAFDIGKTHGDAIMPGSSQYVRNAGSNLSSVDLSGCRSVSDLAIKHLVNLCGPSLVSVNLAWTGVGCVVLLLLAGLSLKAVQQEVYQADTDWIAPAEFFVGRRSDVDDEFGKAALAEWNNSKMPSRIEAIEKEFSESLQLEVSSELCVFEDRVFQWGQDGVTSKNPQMKAEDDKETRFVMAEIDKELRDWTSHGDVEDGGIEGQDQCSEEAEIDEAIRAWDKGQAVQETCGQAAEPVAQAGEDLDLLTPSTECEGDVTQVDCCISTGGESGFMSELPEGTEPTQLSDKAIKIPCCDVIGAETSCEATSQSDFRVLSREDSKADALNSPRTSCNELHPAQSRPAPSPPNSTFLPESLRVKVAWPEADPERLENTTHVCELNKTGTEFQDRMAGVDHSGEGAFANRNTHASQMRLAITTEALTGQEFVTLEETPDSGQKVDLHPKEVVASERLSGADIDNPVTVTCGGIATEHTAMATPSSRCNCGEQDSDTCEHAPSKEGTTRLVEESDITPRILQKDHQTFRVDTHSSVVFQELRNYRNAEQKEISPDPHRELQNSQTSTTVINESSEHQITDDTEQDRVFCSKIQSLDLSSISFHSQSLGSHCLNVFSQANRCLKKLALSWSGLDDSTLVSVLQNQPELESLSVVDCESLGSASLLQIPVLCPRITHVDLKGVYYVRDSNVAPLIESEHMVSLSLAEAPVTDSSLVNLGKKCGSTLTELDFSWCEEISDAGMATVIESSPGLRCLGLRQCRAGSETLNKLAFHCQFMTSLNIAGLHHVDDDMVVALATNLSRLVEVDLSWNLSLTDKAVHALLSRCMRLRQASLSGLKRITSAPFLWVISDLTRWHVRQATFSYRKQRAISGGWSPPSFKACDGAAAKNSDEVPFRSLSYAPCLRHLTLEYSDKVNDDHLAQIVCVCRGTLHVRDYYGQPIEPKWMFF